MTGLKFENQTEDGENTIGPFKVLLVGDANVGKTSILKRYAENRTTDEYTSTIGIDFKMKIVKLGGRRNIKLQLWDTAGQERFRGMCRSYYRGADAIVFVYDVTNIKTFENINFWINELEATSQKDGMPWNTTLTDSTHCALVGNKCDLVSDRQVSPVEAQETADKLKVDHFLTSARDNSNVEVVFDTLAQALWLDWETSTGKVPRVHTTRGSQSPSTKSERATDGLRRRWNQEHEQVEEDDDFEIVDLAVEAKVKHTCCQTV